MDAHDPTFTPGVLAAVGNTPLVPLGRLSRPGGARVWAKLEFLNPGGSAKDRPAAGMIDEAMRTGRLRRGDLVVESSSGNMAVGLAQTCAARGLRFLCVADHRMQRQNVAILRAYGAGLEFVEVEADEDRLPARLARVREIVASTPRAWWPNQYGNPVNPASHEQGTMREIDDALEGRVHAVFVATGTTGTVGGCLRLVAARRRSTCVVAVDAEGSALFGGTPGSRPVAGFGAGVEPPLARRARPHLVVRVSPVDCVVGCRRLVRHEGILAGGSSGGVVSALERLGDRFPPGANVVAVLADRGCRYLDTIYDDAWVEEHLGFGRRELEARVRGDTSTALVGRSA